MILNKSKILKLFVILTCVLSLGITTKAYADTYIVYYTNNIVGTYKEFALNSGAWIMNVSDDNIEMEVLDNNLFTKAETWTYGKSPEMKAQMEKSLRKMGGTNSIATKVPIRPQTWVGTYGDAYRITWRKAGLTKDMRQFDIRMTAYDVWVFNEMPKHSNPNMNNVTSDYLPSVFAMIYDYDYGGVVPWMSAATSVNKKYTDWGNDYRYVPLSVTQKYRIELLDSETHRPINQTLTYRFYDIDTVRDSNYPESVGFISGWKSPLWIQDPKDNPNTKNKEQVKAINKDGMTVIQSNENGSYTTNPYTSVVAQSAGGESRIQWSGCRGVATVIFANATDLPQYPRIFGDLYGYKSDIEHNNL